MSFNYNKKYIFISDGTWFDKGTKCILEDEDALFRYDNADKSEITYQEMLEKPETISGHFQGKSIKWGSNKKIDNEFCNLSEFKIVVKQQFIDKKHPDRISTTNASRRKRGI